MVAVILCPMNDPFCDHPEMLSADHSISLFNQAFDQDFDGLQPPITTTYFKPACKVTPLLSSSELVGPSASQPGNEQTSLRLRIVVKLIVHDIDLTRDSEKLHSLMHYTSYSMTMRI